MPRYNFSYRPVDSAFAAWCVAYAGRNFASVADDYLLDGRTALPHITLCQFMAPTELLPRLWEQVAGVCQPSCNLDFDDKLCFQPGTGHTWTWLDIASADVLKSAQRQAVECLKNNELAPLRATEDHVPHLTFASLTQIPEASLLQQPASPILRRSQSFYLTLGASAESGAYTQELYRVPQIKVAL